MSRASVVAPSVQLPLSVAVKQRFADDLFDWVELHDDFFPCIEHLLALPRWTPEHERVLVHMVHNGMGFALDRLLGDSCVHWNRIKTALPSSAFQKPRLKFDEAIDRFIDGADAVRKQKERFASACNQHAKN